MSAPFDPGFPDFTGRAADPDAVAIEERAGPVSHRALARRAAQAAAWLNAQGVQTGVRVAILLKNRSEGFELLAACGRIGAILVPLNLRMPGPELEAVCRDCQPAITICEDELTELARGHCGGRVVRLGDYCAGRDRADDDCPAAPSDETRPWYLIYTSGTTAAPKGVINTPRMSAASAANIVDALSLTAGDVTLGHLPVYYTAGINLVALPLLALGGRVILQEGFDATDALERIQAGALTVFFSVPAVYRLISQADGFDAADLSAVTRWACGGAALPLDLHERFAGKGAIIRHGYGLSESGPTTLIQDLASAEAKPGGAGRPQRMTQARIVDETGRTCPPDAPGEIQLRGPGMTPGYWNRPDESASLFTDGGWLRTGDIAVADEDGDIQIVGRAKDMYVSGGANVFPAEIEAVLARHPDIADAAIVPGPSEEWGEVGHAFFEPLPGRAPEVESLRAWCRARLAAYKTPASFTQVTAFDRTPSGKIRKTALSPPVTEPPHGR